MLESGWGEIKGFQLRGIDWIGNDQISLWPLRKPIQPEISECLKIQGLNINLEAATV
jgi:hypothetical protein